MATLKRMRVKLGKAIRRQTGLKLPVAMRAAKLIAGFRAYEMDSSEMFTIRKHYCGDGCCYLGAEIVGPKGSYEYI